MSTHWRNARGTEARLVARQRQRRAARVSILLEVELSSNDRHAPSSVQEPAQRTFHTGRRHKGRIAHPMTRPDSCLIICVDGAVPELIEAYARSGLLPNIRRLIQKGAWAEHCLPPLPNTTPTCWATVATGASPGTHGVTSGNLYDRSLPLTRTRRHQGYESQSTKVETLWEAAEHAGIDSLLVSYPTSWPPKTKGVYIGTTDTSATDGAFGIKHQLFSTEDVPGRVAIRLEEQGDHLAAVLSPELSRGRWTVEEMLGQDAPQLEPFSWIAEVTRGDDVLLREASAPGRTLTKLAKGEWTDDLTVAVRTETGPRILKYRAKAMEVSFCARKLMLYITRMVSCPCVSPPALRSVVDRVAGIPSYRDYFHSPLMDRVDVNTFIEINEMGFGWMAGAVERCQEAKPCGITCVYTVSLDTVNHLYRNILDGEWPVDRETFQKALEIERRTYQAIDGFVGKLLSNQQENRLVVLVSDHSAVSYARAFEVEEALRRAGLLVTRETGHGQEIVLEQSRAIYQPSSYVFVNLSGRNPGGIVAEADHEEVVNRIIAALYDYTDPETGRKPVALALRRDDARIVGLCGEGVGDVVVAVGRGFGKLPGDQVHGHRLPGGRYGDKRMESLLLFAGPGIREGCRIERSVSLKDIAPTIAHLMGFPVPRDAEGGVMYQMLAP